MELLKKKSLLGQIGLFYAAAVWGSTFYLIRDVVTNTDPLVLTSYRFLISAFFLGLYLLIKKEALWSNLKYGFGMSLLVTMIYAFQALGLQFTSAASSGFITGLFVAFVPFFAWIAYRKIPEFNKFLAVAVAVIGLWFLTGGFSELNLGDALTLITAVTYALHVLFTGFFVKKLSPNTLVFQQFFFTGLICAALALLRGSSFAVPTNASLFSIIYLALIPTLSALIIQVNAQKYVPEIKAAILMSFEPVFAALFAWTIGGEVFSYSKLIGGLFIFLAMIVSELKWQKRSQTLLLMMLVLSACSKAPEDAESLVTLDGGEFTILAPEDWQFIPQVGIDSTVGKFSDGEMSLSFDYGFYTGDFMNNSVYSENPSAYLLKEEVINGLAAKIYLPKESVSDKPTVLFIKNPRGLGPCTESVCGLEQENFEMLGDKLTEEEMSVAVQIFRSVDFSTR